MRWIVAFRQFQIVEMTQVQYALLRGVTIIQVGHEIRVEIGGKNPPTITAANNDTWKVIGWMKDEIDRLGFKNNNAKPIGIHNEYLGQTTLCNRQGS